MVSSMSDLSCWNSSWMSLISRCAVWYLLHSFFSFFVFTSTCGQARLSPPARRKSSKRPTPTKNPASISIDNIIIVVNRSSTTGIPVFCCGKPKTNRTQEYRRTCCKRIVLAVAQSSECPRGRYIIFRLKSKTKTLSRSEPRAAGPWLDVLACVG